MAITYIISEAIYFGNYFAKYLIFIKSEDIDKCLNILNS